MSRRKALRAKPDPGVTANEVWWINPWKFALFFLIPGYAALFLMPELFGDSLVPLRHRRYFDLRYFLLGLLFLSFFLYGAALAAALRLGGGPRRSEPCTVHPYVLDFIGLATIAAYVIWFNKLLVNPAAILGIFTGAAHPDASRVSNPTIAGITTATQFGIAYVIFYLNHRWVLRLPFASLRYSIYFWIIVGLAVFRVFGWAERLALIELVVPIAVIAVAYRFRASGPVWRGVVRALPLLGIAFLLLFFAGTEYVRSWSAYYQFERQSYSEFVISRVATYYYTALNNGAGMLEILEWPRWEFRHTLAWLHRFPLLVGPIFGFLIDVRPQMDFLSSYADPEFNNYSGVFTVFFDLGVAGALIYAFVWGGLMATLYRGFATARGLGFILYPGLYISALEMLRLPYLGESRVFPFILIALVTYAFFRVPADEFRKKAPAAKRRMGGTPLGSGA